MSKIPYFPFYAQDFLVGTMFFSDQEVGIYVRLLCTQHQHGGLIDLDTFTEKVKKFPKVRSKFIKTDDGWYNKRLMDIMVQTSKKSNNMSANALKRWDSAYANAMQKHSGSMQPAHAIAMQHEDEDEIENEIVLINNKDGTLKRKSPEGIMFVSWGRHPANLTIHERDQLAALWDLAKQDPVLFEDAFKTSVQYGAKKFIYVQRVLEGHFEKLNKIEAKKREHENALKKIEEAKDHVEWAKGESPLRDILESIGEKKKPEVVDEDYKKSNKYKKLQKYFNKKLKEGE